MTTIKLMPDMAAERSAAIETVREHFNRLALENLHDDLAQIARGMDVALDAVGRRLCVTRKLFDVTVRDKRKQELLAMIEAARTPTEIQEALSKL